MIGRLGERRCYTADALVPEVRQSPESCLVTFRDFVVIFSAVSRGQLRHPVLNPLNPALRRIWPFAKNVIDAFVAIAEFGADQRAITKGKPFQMVIYHSQVLVIKFRG